MKAQTQIRIPQLVEVAPLSDAEIAFMQKKGNAIIEKILLGRDMIYYAVQVAKK